MMPVGCIGCGVDYWLPLAIGILAAPVGGYGIYKLQQTLTHEH